MRNLYLAGALAFLLPCGTVGQELTAEQQEVWQTVEACWAASQRQDVQAVIDCFHEDYSFWWAEDVLPFGKDLVRNIVPINLPNTDYAVVDARPARIVVRGDVAIVHFGVRFFERDSEGALQPTVERISMTLLKENGRWRYFGGGGSPVNP
jgi:ketosteroid isomerase-like protein